MNEAPRKRDRGRRRQVERQEERLLFPRRLTQDVYKRQSCLSLPCPPGTLMSIRLLMYRLSSGAASYLSLIHI